MSRWVIEGRTIGEGKIVDRRMPVRWVGQRKDSVMGSFLMDRSSSLWTVGQELGMVVRGCEECQLKSLIGVNYPLKCEVDSS